MSAPNSSAAPASHSQWVLFGQRRFLPFFLTQLFGAANDNIFKVSFTLLVTYFAARYSDLSAGVAANLISGAFILPFVLLSATSGQIADKFDKARLMQMVKALEVAFMALGAAGFLMHSFALLLATTFLMGVHSTLFGPVKFAYLPQHLADSEIVGGNGLVEMGTFVAILAGTMLAGTLVDMGDAGPHAAAIVCIGVAVVGLAVSLFIPKSPAADPGLKINWNPVTETWRNLKLAHASPVVFRSLLGISWLWFFGATFLTQFAGFAKDVIGGNVAVVTLLLAVFSLGIGIGSVLCERLSGRMVEIGLVPFGSIGMSVFAIDLYFASRGLHPVGEMGPAAFLAQTHHWRILADLFLLAMFAGFYSVPLYSLIQTRSEASHRSRIIAANNILNAIFMVIAAGMAVALLGPLHFTVPQLFLVVGLLNALVAAYIYLLVPEFLLRFLAWILVNGVYRIKKSGTERIPAQGAALLICNHVSFVDAIVLMAASPRPIRFVMDHAIFRTPVLGWIFRHGKAIPIASAKEHPETYERAFAEVSKELADGQLVCIFPEGRITDNGELYPFKAGMMKILARDPVPVIPMALQGLWGSFFSRKNGPAMTKPFRRGILAKIGLTVGEPVAPADVTPEVMQAKVLALRGDWK
jgi:1-acyl-sn-glycerol-3-phosphate acyltransferase